MTSPVEQEEVTLPKGSLIWIKYDYKCPKIRENLKSAGAHFTVNPTNDPTFLIIKDIIFNSNNTNIISNLEDYFDNEFNSIKSLPIQTHICDENVIFITGDDLMKIQPI